MREATTISVGGPAPYDVVVGSGVRHGLAPVLGGATTVAVVADPAVAAVADAVASSLQGAARRVVRLDLVSGEAVKSVAEAARLWDELGSMPLTRSDALVAVGGGATTDLVGFVAATWLRGVRVAHVPTTLLGMVDAAVGGKTGLNIAAGKNLVGAFHPPVSVAVDLDVLATLPPAEWVNGIPEVIKTGFIADPVILDLVEADPAAATRPDGAVARELIERTIRVKAKVVSEDLREAGLREILNYGHTLGHAIERRESYSWPHGHAVSVGLVFAAALARSAGRLDDSTASRHRRVLDALGLPTRYPADALPDLMEGMRVDKKARGDRLRFVVLDGLARPGVLEAPSLALLAEAYSEVAS
jgi:3-dehydroquinate synthase